MIKPRQSRKLNVENFPVGDMNMFLNLYCKASSFIRSREAVTAIEYAVVAVAIGGVVTAVFTSGEGSALQTALSGAMTKITGFLK